MEMPMFDYFGVLISIVFGLALTHLLRGLACEQAAREKGRAGALIRDPVQLKHLSIQDSVSI
jgi:hypothetical protein